MIVRSLLDIFFDVGDILPPTIHTRGLNTPTYYHACIAHDWGLRFGAGGHPNCASSGQRRACSTSTIENDSMALMQCPSALSVPTLKWAIFTL